MMIKGLYCCDTMPTLRCIILSILTIFIIMLSTTISNKNMVSALNNNEVNEDILCLKSIKQSIEDPHNNLLTWDVNNPNITNPGFICKFVGISCWNILENRVLGIDLSYLGLKGKFPIEISKCNSLTTLDLSHNQFYGSIPGNISSMLPFLVTLSLSSNRFSGNLPASLGSCEYLNELKLDYNRFSGNIPSEIGNLQRIKEFSVANNLLVGPVPHFVNGLKLNATSYANNPGLCGYPLKACKPN